MNLKMIKGLVGSVAPTLATAMGSPLAGAAMSVIADKLGVKNEPKEIEKAFVNVGFLVDFFSEKCVRPNIVSAELLFASFFFQPQKNDCAKFEKKVGDLVKK